MTERISVETGAIEATAQRIGIGKLSTSALTRLIVLTILDKAERPVNGVEIRKRFEALTNTEWRPSDDLLYNGVLRHLEQNGLLVAFKEKPKRGHSKVYYQISPLGRRLLPTDQENLVGAIRDTQKLLDAAVKIIYGQPNERESTGLEN